MEQDYTPILSSGKIKVDDIDLYEDAWGLKNEFTDVLELLGQLEVVPGKYLTQALIDKIRSQY
jgi:hypothetical protein